MNAHGLRFDSFMKAIIRVPLKPKPTNKKSKKKAAMKKIG